MAANLNVEWSDEADLKLSDFHDQILSHWGTNEAERFLDLVQEFERIISMYPKAFIRSQSRRNVRLGLIHKHVSAVYLIQKDRILILALIDNRSADSKSR